MKRILALAFAALAALALAAPAMADTVVLGRPSAVRPANLSSYGSTFAWSERAPDGSYRLIVRSGAAAPVAAPIPSFTEAVDPDVGPAKGGGVAIVYSRCAESAGCNIFRYVPGAAKETRINAIYKDGSVTTAPSTYNGMVLFARRNAPAPAGTFLYRPGKGTRRLDSKVATATDLSAFRAAILYTPASQYVLRLSKLRPGTVRTVSSNFISDGNGGDVYGGPVLTRYYVYWRLDPVLSDNESYIHRVAIKRPGTVQSSPTKLPAGLDLAVAQRPSGLFNYFDPDISALPANPPLLTNLMETSPLLTFS